MRILVDGYPHRTGEHCASTALRNIVEHRGLPLSEPMVFGLGSGLGFFYLRSDDLSPSRMFHGRTISLEADFGANTGMDFVDREEPDDDRAEALLRARIDAGQPVMLSTDTFYLGYQNTTSHFPGHRCVAVGYDDETGEVFIADRKESDLQVSSFAELRQARNARDHPMPCRNQWGDFGPRRGMGRPLDEAIALALERCGRSMLEPEAELPSGIPAMREAAGELPRWTDLPDWSWAARFAYQVVIKRGAGGSFFRSLFADFLREAEARLPTLAALEPSRSMDRIAASWRELATVLKQQSERERCAPELFVEAGRRMAVLADAEEAFFEKVVGRVAAA